MENLKLMTPAELQLAVIQIEQSLYMNKVGEVFVEKPEVLQLKAIKKEISDRKKDFWRPDVLKIVKSTGQANGSFKSKYGSRLDWEHKIRTQTAGKINVVSFDIIV
mgnify:FL=1